jgi:hypothetical protein
MMRSVVEKSRLLPVRTTDERAEEEDADFTERSVKRGSSTCESAR